MKLENSKGKVWYGLHFYPGLAEYQDAGSDPYRVFLNEDTLRKMDPSFAGRPIFVEHVDEVDPNLNELRKEAEGWVVESFFNSSDGCHWVKFITVTESAERAIQTGHRLSNAYLPKSFKEGGLWNGISYQKEITDGEYEHLALVKHPRYEESVIMNPDEFKQYNEKKVLELKKLSNSHNKGTHMKFSFFKRTKVENGIDPELLVILPKSGKEMSLIQIMNAMDEKEVDKNSGLADMSHKVKMDDGSYMNVGELMAKHKAMNAELEEMKKKKEDESEKEMDVQVKEEPVDSESAKENVDEMHPEKEVHDEMGDDEAKKKALQLAEHEDKEIKDAKKKNAFEKAERLRNAHLKSFESEEPETVELSYDRVARGKKRYGSK